MRTTGSGSPAVELHGAGGVEISTLHRSPVLTAHTPLWLAGLAGLGYHLFVKSGVWSNHNHIKLPEILSYMGPAQQDLYVGEKFHKWVDCIWSPVATSYLSDL